MLSPRPTGAALAAERARTARIRARAAGRAQGPCCFAGPHGPSRGLRTAREKQNTAAASPRRPRLRPPIET
eukprot:2012071-Pyramimonas_sp.AAC.1